MGITQLTPASEINRYIEEQAKHMVKALVRQLKYIGETVVNHAKELPSPSAADFPTYPDIPPHQPNYMDWTGNLRASIGYAISVDGRLESDFGFDLSYQGGRDGARYAKEVARKFPEGIVLIVTAGMHYASYVTDRGYDVIDSAELLAGRLVPQMLRTLGFK